jgi:hypothetical protein
MAQNHGVESLLTGKEYQMSGQKSGLKKRTWIIGGVIAALVGTGAVAARYHNHSMEDRADYATYMITKKLELNDAQEMSLEKLAKGWMNNAGTMKTFRKSMFDEVKTLAGGENLTVAQLNDLRDKVKAEIDLRTDQMIPELVAFYNGLDSDQRAKVMDRLERVSGRMEKGGFGHRRGHHGHGSRMGHDDE